MGYQGKFCHGVGGQPVEQSAREVVEPSSLDVYKTRVHMALMDVI